jgi:hypothetical protein
VQQGQRIQDGPRGQQGAYCREQPQSVGEVVKVSYHSPTAELLPHALVLSAQQEPIPIPAQYKVAINTSTVVATLSTLILILFRVCDTFKHFVGTHTPQHEDTRLQQAPDPCKSNSCNFKEADSLLSEARL